MYLASVPGWGVGGKSSLHSVISSPSETARVSQLRGALSPGSLPPSHPSPSTYPVSKWQLAHPPMGRKKPLDPSREMGVSAQPLGIWCLPSSPEWSGRQGSWGRALAGGRGKAPQCHGRCHCHCCRCRSLCIFQDGLCAPSLIHSLLSPHVQR